MTERSERIVLAVGDAAALTSFAVIGLLSHDEGVTANGILRNAGPVVAGWFAAAGAVGTYRRPGLRTLLPAWGLGVPAGVVLRTLILRHGFGRAFLSFGGVTLAVTLGLLLSWRGLAWGAMRAGRGRERTVGGRGN